jgi:PilZ domain
VACEHKELVGKDIQVRLKLDSPSRSLSLSGIVAYAIDNEIGVRFKDLSAEQQPVLKDYVEARRYNQPVV